MTCAEKTLILFFLFLLSFFAPKTSVLRKREHDGQRTEEKLQKAVSGRARGVGERILPERENIDIQKTSEKFCDPQIYP